MRPGLGACSTVKWSGPAFCLVLMLGGCSVFEPIVSHGDKKTAAGTHEAGLLPPLATHNFPIDEENTGVVGLLQVTYARHEDTLGDLARRFNLGYDEIVRANPGVDPWLPGEGTRIVLPTQFVLPDAPREGIVINLPALRMFYFPKLAKGEQAVVVTHPIGIGKVGWATPVGRTKVVSKRKDPTWTPPASVRREHAEKGDVLPAVVPAGPDNPLGAYAMRLGWPSYLIHGTNKPAGVGMRVSHGCIRLYPEDIEAVFDQVPVGTKVRVVNQPVLYRWQDDSLYVQAFPPLAVKKGKTEASSENVLDDDLSNKMWQVAKPHAGFVDLPLTKSVVEESRGIAVPVSRRGVTLESLFVTARRVENAVPEGATWAGNEAENPGDPDPQPVAAAGIGQGR
jgi:L,D-transpeptidase ErfK/SrfK